MIFKISAVSSIESAILSRDKVKRQKMNEALVCFVLCSCKTVIPTEGKIRYCKGLKSENKNKK